MNWYRLSKNDDEVKRLEKEARRHRLGEEIEQEVSSLVHSIVTDIVLSGIFAAMAKPDVPLSPPDGDILSFPTEEFLAINRIPPSRYPENLNIEVIPSLTYKAQEPPRPSALYDPKDKVIILFIEFDARDIMGGPDVFAGAVGDRLTLMAYHEVLHFIQDIGELRMKTKRYVGPKEDPIQYIFQDKETENHLSDLHNFLNGSFPTLVHNVSYAIGYILDTHKFPEGKKKKKIQTRVYNTIEEMDRTFEGSDYSGIVNAIKGAMLSALRNNESGIHDNLAEAKRGIDELQQR